MDPAAGAGGAATTAASVATQLPAPSLAAAPHGAATGQDQRIEAERAYEATQHGEDHSAHPLTVEPESKAAAAPRRSADHSRQTGIAGASSPAGSSAGSTTSPQTESDGAYMSEKHPQNDKASIDEKVQDALLIEKKRKEERAAGDDDDAKAGKKSKKAKKDKKLYDKRDPVEIALEDPELAHLDPVRRKIIAEQIAVIKRPPAGFFELFRYTTKFELFLNAVGIICAIAAGVAQ